MDLIPKNKNKLGDKLEPNRLFVFGQSKVGKTTALANLPNNLIIDFEEGTKYLESYAINVNKYLKESENGSLMTPIGVVRNVFKELKAGEHNFRTVTFDTADYLELYMGHEVERQNGVDDYRDMEYGKGYAALRDAIIKMLDTFTDAGFNVVVIAHRKKSIIGESGKEINVQDVDLTGKLKNFMFGWADAIGYMHRIVDEQNPNLVSTALNFKSDVMEALEAGCRIPHLANRSVPIITMDIEKNKIVNNNWKEIFPSIATAKAA